MTKREICERLMNIHNRLFHEYAMADGIEDFDLEEIGKDIGSLLLDIAAPEEAKEEPKLAMWSWWDCIFKKDKETGRPCEKEDCRECNLRPKGTIPVCDVHLLKKSAAPEEEAPKAEAPKAEEPKPEAVKEDAPLIKVDGKAPRGWCPKCGAPMFKKYDCDDYFCPACKITLRKGSNWSYTPDAPSLEEPKRGEGR